jgi:hypothetical protein
MDKISINYQGHPGEAEAKLEKAVFKLQELREEGKQLPVPYLRNLKGKTDKIIARTFEAMIQEIAEVVTKEAK